MALQDILDAIVEEADKQIADARAAHQKELSKMREDSERNLSTKKQETAVQKEQKKNQLKTKAQAHGEAIRRNELLKKKQELLDSLYKKVTKKLCSLPEKEVEPLLRECIKLIKEKGDIFPSEAHENILKKLVPSQQFSMQKPTKAQGGFLFVSKDIEQDFTFEHLVEHALRPATELDSASQLF